MTQEDRGITIAKPLAWTVLTALIGGGIWIGLAVQELSEVARRVDRAASRISTLESRATIAERDTAVVATRLDMILGVVERIDARFSKMEDRQK
jgi:pseudouridine-5'-phosphate glycosidase